MNENGIVVGLVTDLNDPQKLGRVRVKFPHLDDEQSFWARLAAPMAGKERGFFIRPEVDDEVLVAFVQGDIRFPYIIGALWNSKDKPPPDDGKAKENNWRFFRSRSGHLLKFNDTAGSESIELIDKDQKRKIIIDCAGAQIQIICDNGDVAIKAQGKVTIEANSEINLKAGGNMTLEATGKMTIKGSTVNIN
jgi:uncharacterized protein involved in type VI secretion and phage assembly